MPKRNAAGKMMQKQKKYLSKTAGESRAEFNLQMQQNSD